MNQARIYIFFSVKGIDILSDMKPMRYPRNIFKIAQAHQDASGSRQIFFQRPILIINRFGGVVVTISVIWRQGFTWGRGGRLRDFGCL